MQTSSKTRPIKANTSVTVPNGFTTISETYSRPATSGTTAQSVNGPQTSLADPDELQRKITNLMMQAATQEENTKRKAEIYAAQPAKMSPFQWGKRAFVKASHAIKDRLSSHSIDTPPKSIVESQSHVSLNNESEASSFYDTDEDDTRNRLNRRIAEGQNLANPKIQAMVGDGNIPRKPLPVYESMKSRSQRSGSLEDPFSDGHEANMNPSPHIDGTFDIDFDKRTNEKMTIGDPVSTYKQIDGILAGPQQHLSVPQSALRFSNLLSGLAQHSDVMDFSSSPVGFSTPRVRLEPQPLAGSKRKTRALSKSPSILDFSFEGKSDDEESLALSTNSKSVTDGSQSVKRKSAHSDLRSPAFPLNKKSKLVFMPSSEETSLAAGISHLATEEGRAPLSSRDANSVLRSLSRPAAGGRGLHILELGKGKEPATRYGDESKKPRPRPIIGRRSSLPRPSSMIFSGREARPSMKRLTSIDADSMDIDELQLDNAEYQVGRKRR